MRISDKFRDGAAPISFEVFPPKGELDEEQLRGVISGLAELDPAFISVTCSAGGVGASADKTAVMAGMVQNEFGIDTCAHVTCMNSCRAEIDKQIAGIKALGLTNVLALRGDPMEGREPTDFRHASDLIPILTGAGFCVGAACYPEGHIESDDEGRDFEYMKLKQDLGVSYFVSQMFFDDRAFFRFLERARRAGVTVPITPGIMPVRGRESILHMVFKNGVSLPAPLVKILYRYGDNNDDLRRAGLEYAAKQIRELLAAGSDGVHIYSMNKPDVASALISML